MDRDQIIVSSEVTEVIEVADQQIIVCSPQVELIEVETTRVIEPCDTPVEVIEAPGPIEVIEVGSGTVTGAGSGSVGGTCCGDPQDKTFTYTGNLITQIVSGDRTVNITYDGCRISAVNDGTFTQTPNYVGGRIVSITVTGG